jgi:flagellin-like hook-associated protein FlgL
MIVNKSMYPIQAGFSSISRMQETLGRLQVQLGTGKKAGTLAEMGNDRSYSLSIRDQLNRFVGYGNTMDTVNLRLGVLNNALQRLDEIESDTRLSMQPNTYGDDGLNLVSTPKLARARLDEVITLLNSNVNGRYLMGGNRTEQAPLPTLDELLNGVGGRAGFATIVNERNSADLGADHMGRLTVAGTSTVGPPPTNTVTLAEDGVHPFGFKVSTVSDTSDAIDTAGAVATTKSVQTTVDLATAAAGDTMSVTLKTRDGASQTITLTAVASPATPGAGEFLIGATPDDTADNFVAALNTAVAGATGNLIGSPPAYSADVGSTGLGRLDITTSGSTVTLAEDGIDGLGLGIASATAAGGITAVGADGNPGASGKAGSLAVTFTDQPEEGETVTIGLTLPDGTETTIKLTASDEDPQGPHTFKIGATLQETADNFEAVLKASIQGSSGTPKLDVGLANTELKTASSLAASNNFFNGQGEPVLRVSGTPPETATGLRTGTPSDTVQWYSGQDSADPRRTVGAQIDDGTRVDYGVQANERGFAEMMRTLAVTAVTSFSVDDDTAKGRYDALAVRQMQKLSDMHNGEEGSIEIVATELGITQNTIGKVTERQQAYGAQLETMLATSENITPEQVAMELLAVKTRLEASYAAMASISQLSLANYLK